LTAKNKTKTKIDDYFLVLKCVEKVYQMNFVGQKSQKEIDPS